MWVESSGRWWTTVHRCAHTRRMAKLSPGRLAAARRFRSARGAKHMSQRAVAEAAGVDRAALNRFETGKTWPTAMFQAAIEPVVGMAGGELEEIAAGYDTEPEPIVIRTEEQAQFYVAGILRRIAELEEAATTERERAVLDELRKVVEGR